MNRSFRILYSVFEMKNKTCHVPVFSLVYLFPTRCTRSLLSWLKGTFIFSWQNFTTAITLSSDLFSDISIQWIGILVRRLHCSLLSHLVSNWSDILQSNLPLKLVNAICLPLKFPFRFVNPIHLLLKLLFKFGHYFFLKFWKHFLQRLICR